MLLGGTGVWKISSVSCGFSSIKINYSDYPKSLISRIHEVKLKCVFNKISLYLYIYFYKLYLSRLFWCDNTCYCVNMVSVTSASRYITPAPRYHPRYRSRSSMYIRGLIPRTFAELGEAVPIDAVVDAKNVHDHFGQRFGTVCSRNAILIHGLRGLS